MVNDLTKGTIWKKLLFFAIPMLLSSLVQQLYNTVDLIFVGNFVDKSASAAVGTSGLLITCLVGFFGGMSVGAGVVVAQIFGAGYDDGLRRALHTAITFSLIGGVALTFIGWVLGPVYLRLVNTPADIMESALSYLRIYFISMVSVVTYNMGAGVLRSLGDSRSPLYAQFIGGLFNVGADYVFIRILDVGVNGAAYATMISQTIAMLVVLYRLARLDEAYALRIGRLRIDGGLLSKMVKLGVTAGVQALVITLSNVFIQHHINGFGKDAIAAFAAYFKVELIIYLPIVAFGQAIMAFAGQNMGAGDTERVFKGTRICVIMSVALAAVSSVFCLAAGPVLFRAFSNDPEVIAVGCRISRVTFPFYCIYPVMQLLADSLRGCGRVREPMLIVLINMCVIRTIILFTVSPLIPDVRGVAMTYPVTWALTAICMTIYYFSFRRRIERG